MSGVESVLEAYGREWSRWVLRMTVASLLLALGSALLLVGPPIWLAGGGTSAFVFRIPALFVHLIAWIGLGFALYSLPGHPWAGRPHPERVMVVAFWLSIIGFMAGMLTLPWALPERVGGILFIYLWERTLLFAYFPYVPSVFAPVVAAHAVLFAAGGFLLENHRVSKLVFAASAFLLGLATFSYTIQVAGLFYRWAYLLSGLTTFGYASAAAAWFLEYRGRRASFSSKERSSVPTGPLS